MAPPGTEARYHLWFGNNVTKQSHFDQSHNIYTVLHGMKRVFISPPTQLRRMHQFPRVHGCKRHSMVSYDANDTAQGGWTFQFDSGLTAGLVGAAFVDLLPGQSLYIPPWWIHRVESYADGVAVSVWWPAAEEKALIDELRAVSTAVAEFEPVPALPPPSEMAAAGVRKGVRALLDQRLSQRKVAGAPLSLGAVVAGLREHLTATVGTGAIRALMVERYVPFYGEAALGTRYRYEELCDAAEATLSIEVPAAAREKLARWRRNATAILQRVVDPSIRQQVAQDEAELVIGAALGVAEVQPFLMGCFGRLLSSPR